jgi:hypothetical protein
METVAGILESSLSLCVSLVEGTHLPGPVTKYSHTAQHILYVRRDTNCSVDLNFTDGNADPGNHQFYNINKYKSLTSLADNCVLVTILKPKCQQSNAITDFFNSKT